MKNLNGWTRVGYYGSQYIYAKGKQRRLIDPKTGQTTFDYRVAGGTKHGVINIKRPVSARTKNRSENARL